MQHLLAIQKLACTAGRLHAVETQESVLGSLKSQKISWLTKSLCASVSPRCLLDAQKTGYSNTRLGNRSGGHEPAKGHWQALLNIISPKEEGHVCDKQKHADTQQRQASNAPEQRSAECLGLHQKPSFRATSAERLAVLPAAASITNIYLYDVIPGPPWCSFFRRSAVLTVHMAQ